MSSPGRLRVGAGASVSLVVLLYAVAAALLPLAHHDIVCHLKSSTHCATCVVGSSAESDADTAASVLVVPIDAGIPVIATSRTPNALPFGPSAGRAPPRLA